MMEKQFLLLSKAQKHVSELGEVKWTNTELVSKWN